ncbi:hypothetical protein QZH41_015703 [Actinostola sp. cb2023]|nr:hypothetical protein QZH41_015703 [Actinostola sp. cb2023]
MKIFNRAVEPSRRQISLYKKAIENLSDSLTFDLRAQTFDEYTHELSSKEEPTTTFDLVHFIHTNQHVTSELVKGKPEESFPDQVMKIAVKNGWKYEMFTQEYEIDVTEVFDEDSVKGNLLLDFFAQLVNFRAMAEKAHIEQVLSAMRDQTTVRDGKCLGKKIDVVFVISKY